MISLLPKIYLYPLKTLRRKCIYSFHSPQSFFLLPPINRIPLSQLELELEHFLLTQSNGIDSFHHFHILGRNSKKNILYITTTTRTFIITMKKAQAQSPSAPHNHKAQRQITTTIIQQSAPHLAEPDLCLFFGQPNDRSKELPAIAFL